MILPPATAFLSSGRCTRPSTCASSLMKLYRLGHCQMGAWILWTLQSFNQLQDPIANMTCREMVSIVVEVVGEESAVFRDMP